MFCRAQVYRQATDKRETSWIDISPTIKERIMSTITTSLLPTAGRQHSARARDAANNGRLSQAQAETHSSADFTFLTAEGDKVTLSADSLAQASYTRYDARGTLQGQRGKAQSESLTLTSAQHSAITLYGDLSPEELQDIQEIVQKVTQLASDVFAGKNTGALDEALGFDDFTTLQSFEATLEYSQSLSLSPA